jgi:hypothetical protein
VNDVIIIYDFWELKFFSFVIKFVSPLRPNLPDGSNEAFHKIKYEGRNFHMKKKISRLGKS